MSKKKAVKSASNILSSLFKSSSQCKTSAAKLASKSCDKKGATKPACRKAGKVVGSRVANNKPGCKYYSKTAR